jgi:serine/threonine protein phosphatase PrpC
MGAATSELAGTPPDREQYHREPHSLNANLPEPSTPNRARKKKRGLDIEYAKVSARGDRSDNQDRAAVVVADHAALMLVFDGMGGHANGAEAAATGIQVVQELFMAQQLPVLDPMGFLCLALARAHDAVVTLGKDVPVDFRPRATLAACLVQENGAFWAHIGDSRLYHVRGGRVLRRSRDHSHVEVLIQEGAITEEEAADHPMRNFVECCIGGDSPVPDMSVTSRIVLEPGDVVLACSDGLWSGLSDDEMAAIATPGDNNLADNLKKLSLRALNVNSPYSDNTTGTAIRWLG